MKALPKLYISLVLTSFYILESTYASCQINRLDEDGLKQGIWAQKSPDSDYDSVVWRFKDGYKHGKFLVFFNNSTIAISGSFKNDNLDGKHITYYKSGVVHTESNYLEGVKNGLQKKYDENGFIWSKANYEEGKLNGLYKEYYSNGKIRVEYEALDDLIHGFYKSYHPNGQLALIGNMNYGVKEGTWKKFSSIGEMIEENHY